MVDIYLKPTNSFAHVDPKTCYTFRNINEIPEGIALRLRHICDSHENYEKKLINTKIISLPGITPHY